jgi:radical SAM superfamily enzyme YgiQ (UPF0313 family)
MARGFPVAVHDMQINRLGPESIRYALRTYRPDLVGIGIHAAPFIPAVKVCCEAVKAENPSVPIVVGGIFTSTYGEKIFDVIPEIDIVVLNEGEETIVELAEAIANRKPLTSVPGLVVRNGRGEVRESPPRGIIEDLNALPLPAWDLVDLPRYRRSGLLPPYIEAQRGCSYSCTFCGVHFPNRGQIVRYRDPRRIVDEIELLYGRYGFDRFFFCDDTFTLNYTFAGKICDEITARNLQNRVKWTAYTRADRIEPNVARKLRAAGCYCLALGVETGARQDTASINKRETITEYEQGIQIIKDAGMDVHTLIIFGFPEVTHNDIPMAAKFLLKTRPTMSQFFIFHPTPGTEYFAHPEKFGLHYRFDKLEDWYKTDFIEEPLCDTKHLTREEIIKDFIQYNLAFHSYESPGERPGLQQRLLCDAIPRKRHEVVLMRTGELCLYVRPGAPHGSVYGDMHKNARRLNEMQYEVLLRSNGDFTIEEIAERFAKLFDFTSEDALLYVVNALRRFERLELIHELPALSEYEHLMVS